MKDQQNDELDLATDEELSPEGRYDPEADEDFEDDWSEAEDDFEGDVDIDGAANDDESIAELEESIRKAEEESERIAAEARKEAKEEAKRQAEEESEEPQPTFVYQDKEPDVSATVAVESEDDLRPMTDEEKSELQALETERAAASEISTELQDITELSKSVAARQRAKELAQNPKAELTEEEKKAAKAKAAEEKKRKRQEENDIFANRYKAKTINAAVAQTDPIVYFYNAALSRDGAIQFFNVYQVLQDRFLGKLIPQLWTAVAEASDRVLELNMASLLEHIKVCEQFPEYVFVISISTRFFTKPAVLEKFLNLVEKPIPNLVLAFDCVSLQNLGQAAKTGLGSIKNKGLKILLDNTEKVSMTTLSELEFDFVRIDSRYYELGNFKAEGFLRLLTAFAKEQGIPTVATFCDNEDMAEYMFYMGVDYVQGNAVSRPQRTVPNAVDKVTLLESMQQIG
ncbi:MAG: EAL domain-containing protein [Clostridia bacterium]|nr:EAL domain-containing protein [Clostridia bacterium]